MLLAIDIGNTNIHLGLWDRAQASWMDDFRARTVAEKMPDEYAVLLRAFLNSRGLDFSDIGAVVIGSVVPRLTETFAALAARYLGCQAMIVNHLTDSGITLDIDQPAQAGADRIVNAAAIAARFPQQAAIVIDFGTATTFDIISAAGAYQGGAIAPGIHLAHDALVSRAARLHKIDLAPPPSPIGRNTIDAMQSGIFWGYVGLVEGLVARLKATMGDAPILVVATGGLAPLFDQHTTIIDHIVPKLTLEGLQQIYARNHPVA
jgi:type III pantothenate kinase